MLYLVNKPIGWTPLKTLRTFQDGLSCLKDKKLTYAGRLDPLANGLLLLLDSAHIEIKAPLLNLPKTYSAICLFGIGTDTGDALGLPTQAITQLPTTKELHQATKNLTGTHSLAIPRYASVPSNGKPLWYWEKQGITPPTLTRPMQVTECKLGHTKFRDSKNLREEIAQKIKLISGNFRQQDILVAWEKQLAAPRKFLIAHINISCSSGSYIRSIVPFLAKNLGTDGCLLGLTRTRIGPFSLQNSWQIE